MEGTGINWLELGRQLAIIIATMGAGGSGAYIAVKWLKSKLGWQNEKTLVLVGIVSVVLAVSGMIAAGELGLADLREDNLSNIVLAIATGSQIIYFTMKAKLEHKSEPSP